VDELAPACHAEPTSWAVRPYRTFDELHDLMAEMVRYGDFDAVIHAAAVSDYHLAGTFTPALGTAFDPASGVWTGSSGRPELADVSAGKVKSGHDELWLRLVPAPKLVDMVRPLWGFRGTLVKFKLEVGVGERELERIAEASRVHSGADVIVANTLAGMADWALVGAGDYERVPREQLGDMLLALVESRARTSARPHAHQRRVGAGCEDPHVVPQLWG
jgi:phosphopantothenoylcysteine synthetase/decarboxylase